jgi:rhodanese-related sulfurtransferase
MNIKEVTAEEASQLMNDGALMVDVRETDEVLHHAFQIEEVENIPMSNFDENYSHLPKNRNIVLVCHHGIRSLRVAQFLVIQGWDESKIFSLNGGIDAWELAGLPVKTSPKTYSFIKPVSSCGCDSNGCS